MQEHAGPAQELRSVLIVDDEAPIVGAIKRLLRREGYELLTANSGEEALKILQANAIGVVICDQRMPGMSGAELLTHAYQMQPDSYRITLTGYTDLEAAQQSINEGRVHRFMVKPWDDQTLKQVVAEGLRSANLVRSNRLLQELTQRQNQQLASWNQRLESQVAERTAELEQRHDELAALRKRAERSLMDFVVVFAGLLEMSSPALGIHSRRVAELAKRIGTLAELGTEDSRALLYAAHLHDIGKLTELAPRPEPARRARGARPAPARSHADVGASLLARVHGFEPIAQAIKHQCEDYDGGGKPAGLRADRIPLLARIIRIANVYDEAVFNAEDPVHPDYAAGLKALDQQKGRAIDPYLSELLAHDLQTNTTPAEAEIELSYRQLKPGMRLARDLLNFEGMLLLKKDTVLNEEIVEKIRMLCQSEMLLNTICVITLAPACAAAQAEPQDENTPAADEQASARDQKGSGAEDADTPPQDAPNPPSKQEDAA